MNERIDELADQAIILVAEEHTKGDLSRLDTDSYRVQEWIRDKFAELIIKECSNVINTDIQCQVDQGVTSNVFGLNQARYLIEAHFGVNE
jgi:hypothetical protein